MKLTKRQVQALEALLRYGPFQGYSLNEVAEYIGTNKIGAGVTLASLEREGLARREKTSGGVRFSLTAHGRVELRSRGGSR